MKIWALIKKELIEILRQKEFASIIFIMPMIQIFIFGYVLTTDMKRLPVEIVDLSGSETSLRLIHRMNASSLFSIRKIHRTSVDAISRFQQGKAKAILILRNSSSPDISQRMYPEVQILLDGVDSNTSQLSAGYFQGIIRTYLLHDLERKGKVIPIQSHSIIRFNPQLRSINYMGPGLVAILLTIIALMLSSVSLVREKEQQTIDTLLISPLRALEIYIGKAIPVGIVALMTMSSGLLVVLFWFRVPMRGNWLFFLVTVLIYLAAVLAYGLLISTFASTQQEAMFFSWFSMISFLLLSGFLTPMENAPYLIRMIARGNPTFFLMRIIREIFLKGNGPLFFYSELISLGLIAMVVISISLLNYQRKMRY